MFVIFSIDDEKNAMRLNIFMGFVAEVQGRMKGLLIPAVGAYNGVAEHCFICREDDFNEFFRDTFYMHDQESVLFVASGNKMEARLEYLSGSKSAPPGTVTGLGCMHEVTETEAKISGAYLYRQDLNTYWVAKQGNPDNAHQKSEAAYNYAMAA